MYWPPCLRKEQAALDMQAFRNAHIPPGNSLFFTYRLCFLFAWLPFHTGLLYRLARWPSGSSRFTRSLQPENSVRRNHLFQEFPAKASGRWCLVQLADGPFPDPITAASLLETLITPPPLWPWRKEAKHINQLIWVSTKMCSVTRKMMTEESND